MAYDQLEIRSFQGLFLQQNSFQVPDGAMEIASRVVIRSDEVITKTNGLYEYWRPDGVSALDDIRATRTFQGKLIGFFATGVGYFTETYPFGGTFNAVGELTANESIAALSFQYGMDSSQQNKNLYFVADQGVFKLEAFDGKVLKAGVPPGLGLRSEVEYGGTEVLEASAAGSQTGYRAVFGRRDRNGNLNLGSPSDVLTIGAPAAFTEVPYDIISGIGSIFFGTIYLDTDATFIVADATNPALNGIQTNTSLSPGVLTFDTIEADSSGTLSILLAVAPTLYVEIPSEIDNVDDQYFVQLSRTSSSIAVEAAPEPNFRLITEVTLTQTDLDQGFVVITDTVDELLRTGPELYTNPNTREGELQENSRPPKAKYLSHFNRYASYANIVSIQRMLIDMVNPNELNGVDLVFKSGINEEVYRAVSTANYEPYNVYPVTTTATGLTIDYGAHTFPLGSILRLSNITGTVVPGDYPITSVAPTTMTITTTGSMTAVTVQVISDGTAFLYNGFSSTDAEGILDTSLTTAEWVELVARDLCRAINANRDSFMYANYRSQFDDFPGKMSIESKDFIDPIYLRYSAVPTNPAFIQNIPDSFSTGIQFYSENDVLPNVVYMSKIGEPEAVPVSNNFPVGTVNAAIVGTFPLKDSLIVLKEDGAYKIIGEVIGQMQAVAIDLTIEFTAQMAQSASVINNTVIAFCNQGVVQITENSVQVISRRIEDVIQPLIGRDLSTTFLFGHESDRLFYVQTSGLNPGEADTTWIYNVLNQSWTSTPDVFRQLSLGTRNELVGVKYDADLDKNTLWFQRKTNTRVDYCGQYVIGDISIDPTNQASGTFTITGGNVAIPEIGDVILSQNIFNRITEVTPDGGDYILTFAQDTAIASGSPVEVTLYKAYESIVKMAPFHAGQVGRSKHFAQLSIHLRQQVITDLSLEFAGAFYGSSEVTNWQPLSLSTAGAQGWGFSPWGLFPWGLVDGANIVAGTEPASIIRTYIPRFAARNTFIQGVFKHKQAGQPMMIQAMSWSIHGYGERVTR